MKSTHRKIIVFALMATAFLFAFWQSMSAVREMLAAWPLETFARHFVIVFICVASLETLIYSLCWHLLARQKKRAANV